MAKPDLPKPVLEQIVATQLPGYVLADDAEADAVFGHAPADATSPGLAALRQKYFADAADYVEVAESAHFAPGTDTGAATAVVTPPPDPAAPQPAAPPAEPGMILVKPQPASDHDAPTAGPGPKAAIVSPTGHIIGAQG